LIKLASFAALNFYLQVGNYPTLIYGNVDIDLQTTADSCV